MRHQLFGTSLLVSIWMMALANAAPIPAIDVPAMTSAADIIVVGRAAGVAFRNALSETFSVSVDRALKGAAQNPPTAVSVRLDVSRPEFQSVIQRQYGIFFLRRTVVGEYTAVDPSHAVLVASPDKAAKPTGPTDLLGSVTRELAQVFVTPPAILTSPPTGIQSRVVGEPTVQLQQIYLAAAEAIRSIPYWASAGEIRRIAESGQVVARLWSLDCLFFMGDAAEIEALKLNYLIAVKSILLHPQPDLVPTAWNLANSMEGHLKSPDAVPTLAELLTSTEVAVRRASASVLSDIATKATIAPLAKALNDPDRNVRYYAVLGLATATESPEAPAMEQFEHKEAEFLGHWRNWAKSNAP